MDFYSSVVMLSSTLIFIFFYHFITTLNSLNKKITLSAPTKLHFKEILHSHIKHTQNSHDVFTEHRKSVQPFWFCCSLTHADISKKLSHTHDFASAGQGWHQPNFMNRPSYKHGQQKSTCTTVIYKHTHGVGHD